MRRKAGIIGAGHVGSHVAASLAMLNICEEIVLIDTDRKKAEAHGTDLQDMVCYSGHGCRIWAGEYEDLADAQVCVVSASGEIFKENRLEELDVALDVMDDIVPKLKRSGFAGTVISITNPCDLVALYLHLKTDFPVIGTGTALDSARFRIRIALGLGVSPDSVDAFCVGEHGDSQVPVWSQVRVGGRMLEELAAEEPERWGRLDRAAVEKSTVEAGWEIANKKGSTEFGIGAAAAELIGALLSGNGKILPCSVPAEYAGTEIYASRPALVGGNGLPVPLPLKLSEKERTAYEDSRRMMAEYRREKLDGRLLWKI